MNNNDFDVIKVEWDCLSSSVDSEKYLTKPDQTDNRLAAQIEKLEKKNLRLSRVCAKQKQAIDNLETILKTAPEVAFQHIDRDGTLFRWNQTAVVPKNWTMC